MTSQNICCEKMSSQYRQTKRAGRRSLIAGDEQLGKAGDRVLKRM